MKKIKVLVPLLIFCLVAFGIWNYGFDGYDSISKQSQNSTRQNTASDKAKVENNNSTNADINLFHRNIGAIDYSGLTFTPWDVKAASANVNKREKKPYTIMIYMNGSDLESESGAATEDLIEMLESGVNADNVNLILFTGGTSRWQNDVIPENNCVIWEARNGRIFKIAGVGLVNMGDPGTLASFIAFSMNNFPAEKYGLVMWDHGGGAIAGYGQDENFNNSNLTLLDMNYAFAMSPLSENKLEFLGFDTCLMATVEMAVIASDYADYLVAAEDLSPGDGWDYGFLVVLNDAPRMDGATLGKAITDYFMNYYGPDSDEILTMSVVDLSNVSRIMGAMGNLMRKASDSLATDRIPSFRTFARKRSGTKTFGSGSPRDNESDMVDIGDMTRKLSDLFPIEANNVMAELEKSVIYNKHNSDIDIKGLSAYYIYGGKGMGNVSLTMYKSLYMNGAYTKYLNDFYHVLIDNTVKRNRSSRQENTVSPEELVITELTLWQPIDGSPGKFMMTGIQNGIDMDSGEKITAGINAPWPMIHGKNVCLYSIDSAKNGLMYAVPSEINGADCDIIILVSEKYPYGKILGKRQEDGAIKQKGYDTILDGDRIAIYYQAKTFGENKADEGVSWYKSDEFTVNGALQLDWAAPVPDKNETYYSLRLTDVRDNEYFTDLKAVQ